MANSPKNPRTGDMSGDDSDKTIAGYGGSRGSAASGTTPGTMGAGTSTSVGTGSMSGAGAASVPGGSSMAGSGGSGTTSTAGAYGASGTSTSPDRMVGGSQHGAAGGSDGARITGDGDDDLSGPGPRLMTASTLEGDKVINRQGEDLGEIDEIMLDVPRGRIAYAVMSSGGFLGMGNKLFAIPWSALTLDTDNKCFVLDVDKQRLESAPGFDKDNWPSMADQEFGSQVHSYYGARPYWE